MMVVSDRYIKMDAMLAGGLQTEIHKFFVKKYRTVAGGLGIKMDVTDSCPQCKS